MAVLHCIGPGAEALQEQERIVEFLRKNKRPVNVRLTRAGSSSQGNAFWGNGRDKKKREQKKGVKPDGTSSSVLICNLELRCEGALTSRSNPPWASLNAK
jgi:hypothetical protein